MHPKELSINDFSYNLPDEKIAKVPLSKRDESKLLCYRNNSIIDYYFFELTELIPAGSLMVFNNTKVVHARLIFQKPSGATIEIFCLEPFTGSFLESLSSTQTCIWKCMVGNAKRWKEGILQKEVRYKNKAVIISARLIKQNNDDFDVEFSWDDDRLTFAELLREAGLLPLPPYLNRDAGKEDERQYQTVYAREEGSVAAPTAGLHFTEEVREQLYQKNIKITELTLHVGAGTFKPVKVNRMENHEMHRESVSIGLNTLVNIRETLAKSQKILAVGTTSLRTLESIYWHGVNLLTNKKQESKMNITQWQPYEDYSSIEPIEAINAVIECLHKNNIDTLSGYTYIIIAPGYRFKMTDILITNFHQPNSTLLLLVAAFIGNDWKKIYEHALDHHYRFLSFGDSSLLFKNQY